MIKYSTGLFFDGRDSFSPRWAIIASFIFLVFLVVFIVWNWLWLGLFKEIISINQYVLNKDLDLIGNATIPVSVESLFTWNIDSDLNCTEGNLVYSVINIDSGEEVDDLSK